MIEVDEAVEELFDRIPALAALAGHERANAKEECRKIVAFAVEPVISGGYPWD